MPRLVWAIPCRRGIVDRFTALVTLMEAVDEVRMPAQPNPGEDVGLELCVVTNWAREDFTVAERSGFCRCSIIAPTGETDRPLILDVRLAEFLRVRNVFRYSRMSYRGLGEYRFRIEWLDEEDQETGRIVAELPLWVQLAAEPKDVPEPAPARR